MRHALAFGLKFATEMENVFDRDKNLGDSHPLALLQMKTPFATLLIVAFVVEAQEEKPCSIKVLRRVFTDLYPVKLAGYDKNIVPHGSEFVTRCMTESGLLYRNWTSYVCSNGLWEPDIPVNLDCWIEAD